MSRSTDPQTANQPVAISPTEPDWSRETPKGFWDPGRKLLRTIRKYQALQNRKSPLAKIQKKYWAMVHRFWSVVTGAEIALNCQIGGGLLIPHPNGIVIHPKAQIGPNSLIFQQVTIGAAHGEVPVLGGHVDLGAGAKIIGGISLGDHVQVGANAVVTNDVDANTTVVGIPARVVSSPTTQK